MISCVYLKGSQASIDRYDNTEYDRIDHRCKTSADDEKDGQSEMVYDLPASVLSKLNVSELISGKSVITIVGAKIHRIPNFLDDIDKFIVERNAVVTVDHTNRRQLTLRRKGISSAVMVRVTAKEASTSLSADKLSEKFFSMDNVSVTSQYDKCSGGQFKFEAAIPGGVAELFYDEDLKGKSMSFTIENDLLILFQEKYGSTDNYDHILFCMPSGMDSQWIGYAYGQTYRSYYNDKWCGYYTLPFHELGHNLGLLHSNEKGKEYDDRSCMMGKSFAQDGSPEQCFNGVKFAQLDWFPEYTLQIDPLGKPWSGQLVAFVDVLKLRGARNTPIILQVGDTFLVFNRAKDYNNGVVEKRDYVTIAQGSGTLCGSCTSDMLGGVHVEDFPLMSLDITFDGKVVKVTFEACQHFVEDGIDSIFLSIRRDNHKSSCDTAENSIPGTQITAAPSKSPEEPTALPTRQPALDPTSSPTLEPTRIPTVSPTPGPTASPTSNPTKMPTFLPTAFPTKSPTNEPTPGPTKTPSLNPSAPPTGPPSLAPTKLLPLRPTLSPTDEQQDTENTLIGCFSGEMIVVVEGKGEIPMRDLELGDKVLTLSNPPKFSSLYSFGHKSDSEQAHYLQILPSKLELTHDHMVFITGTQHAVPASSLRVGDHLASGEVITAINQVTRRGVYAPFTTSGDLLVNGVLVSSYVAYQGSDHLAVGPMQFSYHW
eukprot:CAMPEP_0194236508 /NCGR_PEP_ID=MMETSP0158-20130606/3726_1 /TAXON_ID=33649 /ORGANISM="Thalassionema nitzschioides, Strain L26-B" /LENGTH=707 /DNA_ID=CAMNT_0038970277 /DNA_START=337 /DNA_END=2457 /DNA_ORIENTATION=-